MKHTTRTNITVYPKQWKKFGKRVEQLKKKGIVKSRSNVLSHLIAAFLGTTSQWIENHAYNGAEAELEKNYIIGER